MYSKTKELSIIEVHIGTVSFVLFYQSIGSLLRKRKGHLIQIRFFCYYILKFHYRSTVGHKNDKGLKNRPFYRSIL